MLLFYQYSYTVIRPQVNAFVFARAKIKISKHFFVAILSNQTFRTASFLLTTQFLILNISEKIVR